MLQGDAIQAAIIAIEDANGSKYVSAPVYIATRSALRDLAIAAGVRVYDANLITDADLIALYAVARKRPAAVTQIAAKLSRKYGVNLDPIEPLPRDVPDSPAMDSGQIDAAISKALAPYADKLGELTGDIHAMQHDLADQVTFAVAEALKSQTPTMLTVTPANDSAPVGAIVINGVDNANIIAATPASALEYLTKIIEKE